MERAKRDWSFCMQVGCPPSAPWEEVVWRKVLYNRKICWRIKSLITWCKVFPMLVFVLPFRCYWQGVEMEREEKKDGDHSIFFPQRLENPSSLMNINKYSTFATNKTSFPVKIIWSAWVAVGLHWGALTEPLVLIRTAAKLYGFSFTPSLILVLLVG